MNVTRRSPLTGVLNTLDLPVTAEQMAEFEGPRHARRLIQEIFPALSAPEREFVLSGYTPEDWETLFPKLAADAKVYMGEGNVYTLMEADHGVPFLISVPLNADGTFERSLNEWCEVEEDAEPAAEIAAARAALGVA